MADKNLDIAAVTTAVTSPAWVQALSQINTVLSFVSLILGIAFLAWRWYHANKDKKNKVSNR